MITLKKMWWSNWFSYGEDNCIELSANKLTQILGENGKGKSSIPIILEELAYGKNSKGFSKAEIPNRYTDSNKLLGKVYFDIDDTQYIIELIRTSSIKLHLYREGKDISSHTASSTYKTISNLLGIDFKTFTQLVYQSSTSSLQFLTATDMNRKKFLISLFNLEKYSDIYDNFKKAVIDHNKNVAKIEATCTTLQAFIDKHRNFDFTKKELRITNEDNTADFEKEAASKQHTLNEIESINRKINKNNEYIRQLSNLDNNLLTKTPHIIPCIDTLTSKSRDIEVEGKLLKSKVAENKALLDKLTRLGNKCHVCEQEVDQEFISSLVEKHTQETEEYSSRINTLRNTLIMLNADIKKARELERENAKITNTSSEFEKLSNYIDKSLPRDVEDKDVLQTEITSLFNKIKKIKDSVQETIKYNNEVTAHNTKVDIIQEELAEHQTLLLQELNKLEDAESYLSSLEVLKRSFSPNGLVSYKLEYLVKDLEAEINTYLSDFSDGRFQLVFVLNGDKLNISILDDNVPITVTALSTGQLARVNISTLLAIRKLMSAISNTKLNLLFLDEVMGVLDADGKEKLIEMLFKEENLNTFIVSHEYRHPLIPVIEVKMENKISWIEDGS